MAARSEHLHDRWSTKTRPIGIMTARVVEDDRRSTSLDAKRRLAECDDNRRCAVCNDESTIRRCVDRDSPLIVVVAHKSIRESAIVTCTALAVMYRFKGRRVKLAVAMVAGDGDDLDGRRADTQSRHRHASSTINCTIGAVSMSTTRASQKTNGDDDD